MHRLWTPWRYDYVSGAGKQADCVLCDAANAADDEGALVLYRGRLNYVIVNKYPYTNGHLMVASLRHVADLHGAHDAELDEMMRLVRGCETILRKAYSPDGFNVGLNIGKAAGAGVIGHLHMHVVPRWIGDASFMSATADTRVVPETPAGTVARLRPLFDAFPWTMEQD